jgi:predicted dienelactone hydrolase
MWDHGDTATALATAGWVVVAPEHPRNNAEDNSGAATREVWISRPQQLREAIDAVLADPALGPAVDVNRIGAIGFSAGGYTVLSVIGAIPDPGYARIHCTAHYRDDAACRGGSVLSKLRAVWASLIDSLTGDAEARRRLRDPRVGAAVLMAPLALFFPPGSLAEVRIPVRIYRAGQDRVLSSPFHAERIRAELPIRAEYAVVPGASHRAFLDPRRSLVHGTREGAADESTTFDQVAFHRKLNVEIVEFFDRSLGPTACTPQR